MALDVTVVPSILKDLDTDGSFDPVVGEQFQFNISMTNNTSDSMLVVKFSYVIDGGVLYTVDFRDYGITGYPLSPGRTFGHALQYQMDAADALSYENQLLSNWKFEGTVEYKVGDSTFTASSPPSFLPVDSLALSGAVFDDANVNGTSDAEAGLSDVEVHLYADTGTVAGSYDAGDTLLLTTTTDGSGNYQFTGLGSGNYIVQLSEDNFGSGGALEGRMSSPGSPDPDDNVDNDDNGARVAGQGVVSSAIRLDFNSEPNAGNGNDSNSTLDFGLFANIAPDISDLGGETRSFVEDGTPILLDTATGATVSDDDSANFDGGTVTVSVTGNFVPAEDVLGIRNEGTDPGQIGVSGSDVTYGGVVIGSVAGGAGSDLVISLDADATPAAVSALLRNLTYANANTGNPSTADRTISVTVNDGDGGTSTPAIVTVTVTGADDAPVIGALTAQATEGQAAPTAGTLTIDDADGTDEEAFEAQTNTIGTYGTFSLAADGSYTYTLAAGAEALDDAEVQTDTFTVTSADGTTADFVVSVTGVNDAPTVALASATIPVTEDVTKAITGISIADADNPTGSVTVTLAVPSGTLTAASTNDVVVAGSATAMTLTGTIGAINAFLATDGAVTFKTDLNAAADVSLTVTVDDKSGTASAVSDPATITLDVQAVNDVPVLSGTGATPTIDDTATAQPFAGLTFADVESGGTVTIGYTGANGTLSGTGLSGSAGTYTLTGATPAELTTRLQALVFTPTANQVAVGNSVQTSFTLTPSDGTDTGTPHAATVVTVSSVNDAPTLSGSGTLTAIAEDASSPAGVALGSLGLSASDVDAGGSVTGYAVVGNVATASQGSWQYSTDAGAHWQAVGTVNDGASALALSAATLVRFLPADDYNGTPGGLTLRALDTTYAGGFSATGASETRVTVDTAATGGTTAISSGTASLGTSVTAVNDAPVLATNAGAVAETAGLLTITTSLLDEGDVDDDGAGLTYTVTDATEHGTLFRDGNDNGVVDGGEALGEAGTFTQADLDAGQIKYLHAGGTDTFDSFTFSLADGGEDGAAPLTGQTFAITVAARPVVTGVGGSPSYAEDGSAAAVAPGLAITDGDSTTLTGATVTITDRVNGDVLAFTNQNGISGSYAAATGVLTLTGTASLAHYETALRSVTYSSTSDNPATGVGNADRVVAFAVSDGTLASTGVQVTLSVANANDAPVLDIAQAPALTAIAEDGPAPTDGSTANSTLASSLLSGATDPDAGALQGIAVTGVSGKGTLFYSTDGGGTWAALTGSVSASAALVLHGDARLYFQPDANENGTVTDAVTFKAWDRTGGATNGQTGVNTTTGTAFSTASDTASVVITAVNDAPQLADTVLSIAVAEDAGAPVGAVGAPISSLAGGASDVEAGAAHGLAVTAADATNGTWYFSTDGGANWQALGSPSAAAARLLAADADTRIYFQPNADYQGTVSAGLTIRAWDGTGGTNGGTADVTANGGSTAFSAETDTVARIVTNVNDAPTLAGGPVTLTGVDEDTPSSGTLVSSLLSGLTFGDIDPGAVSGIAITALAGGGSWQYTTDGTTWTGVGSVSGTSALLLSASAHVRFVPDGENGSAASLTFRAWDQTSGTASGNGAPQYADASANGGTTAFSAGTATAAMTVTSVNDAPTLAGSVDTSGLNDNAGATALFGGIAVADVDTGESDLTLEVRLADPGAGALSGGGFTDVGGGVYRATGLTPDQADAALDGLTFTPADNTGPSGTFSTTFTVAANDQTAAEVTWTSGGLTVTRVNDAPSASNLTQATGFTEDDGSVALDDIAVGDADTGESVTATLTLSSPAAGALSTGTFGSATSSFTAGTGVWTVTGSVVDVNAALAAVAFTPAANWDRTVTITSRIRDQAGTGPADGTITLTATAVNDAPGAVTLSNLVTTTAEGGAAQKVADIAVIDDAQGTETLSLVGADAGSFEIRNGAELWFRGGADFEAKTAYAVQVTATDEDGLSATSQAFALAIADLPDTPTGGDDVLVLGSGDNRVNGRNGIDQIAGNEGQDNLRGGRSDDALRGGDGDDLLRGNLGDDRLDGGAGDDVLKGGQGADVLLGGEGADRFVFTGRRDSPADGFDRILDFDQAEGDRLDLSGLGGLSWRGDGGFTGGGDEVRFEQARGNTFVLADLDGDGQADFTIRLDGLIDLKLGDFIL
jgi:VCBS repeat-containing protein